MKNFQIRPETPSDFPQIFELIKNAFATADYSDHQEQFLVERLRNDSAFLPNLALVAENASNHKNRGEIIGHIVFSEALIGDEKDGKKVLALAPLSVCPDYQNQGVGTALIHHAHQIIETLDYPAVVVLGHPDYYAKFGYDNASEFGITIPFDVPDEVLRVWALGDVANVPKGEITYAHAFLG